MQTNAIFPSHQTPAWSVQWVRARPPTPGMGCTMGANLATKPQHGVYSRCEPGHQHPSMGCTVGASPATKPRHGVYSGCEPGHQPPAWGVQWVRAWQPTPGMGCIQWVRARPPTPSMGWLFPRMRGFRGIVWTNQSPPTLFFLK